MPFLMKRNNLWRRSKN